MSDGIKLIEVINTYQGEGPDSGRQMLLLRFKECDRVAHKRTCSWCDTVVKMRVKECGTYTIEEINELIKKSGGIMITGGEPLYDPNVEKTMDILINCQYDIVNIETNGYKLDGFLRDMDLQVLSSNIPKKIKVIYSPKFFDSVELDIESSRTANVINHPCVYIKLVVSKEHHLVGHYLDRVTSKMNPRPNQIWLMPEGTTREELIHNSGTVMDMCEEFKCNFSSREHIIYGFV